MPIRIDDKKLYLADFHIHSRFSRACSKDLNLSTLSKWAKIKGLDILGTGDISHPIWIQELKDNLIDKGDGIYEFNDFKFILSGEISLIYTQERGRKVHLVYLAPNFETNDKINEFLDTLGRRDYDGRPIFKMSCEEFTKNLKNINKNIEIIPAHIWTPHFGVLGSKAGFDSLTEAFGSENKNIFAIETGISSTPDMNLEIEELRNKTIVSFSDSHSFWPWRLGREATILKDIKSYKSIISQIRKNKIIGTIEVNPAYGKYHFDGHRNCNFSCNPTDAEKTNNLCPVCKKELLLGVEHRIFDLKKNNKNNNTNKTDKLTFEILPLHEIISLYLNRGVSTKGVWDIYNKLTYNLGNEFEILLSIEKEKIEYYSNKTLADLIIKNRNSEIKVKPGYDGIYGEVILN